MRFVATLIGAAPGALTEDILLGSRQALNGLGAHASAPDWLAEGEAADLFFHELDPDQADAAIRQAIAGAPVDCIAQPAEERRKRLLIADMESTIIAQEMLDEIAELKGIKPKIAAITARAMNGEIDFIAALKQRVALLAGLPEREIDALAGRITLNPGAADLVATMRRNGARTLLVSGGFTIFADRVGAMLGFDIVSANVLEFSGPKGERALTGDVIPPIRDRNDKLEQLTRQCAADRIQLNETIAVGDGANDLPMLLAAGLGVAYHAKPSVKDAVRARVDHAGLRALLFAQGYKSGEILSS
jgi:phosphoserine phosphatase